MKGKFLEAVIAAGADARSVALATELKSGAQLFLDGDTAEGDLQLDDASIAASEAASSVSSPSVPLSSINSCAPLLSSVASATECPAAVAATTASM